MVEVAVIIAVIPFTMLCVSASIYLYSRNNREHRRQLHELHADYNQQWEEFEAKHKKHFEDDYWSKNVRDIAQSEQEGSPYGR